jgi:hypothetical protein
MSTTPEQRIANEFRAKKWRIYYEGRTISDLRMFMARKHKISIKRLREILEETRR